MDRIRKQAVSRGVVVFAFNSSKYNYVEMAEYCARRADHFLELPTTIITEFLMHPNVSQEYLSSYSYNSLWATVIMFKKSDRAKQIFGTLEMVQNNYDHYANIHSFVGGIYRNDYALTLALKIVNGHADVPSDYIPWNLVHVGKNTSVYADETDIQVPCDGDVYDFNTEFTIMFDHWKKSKVRKEYMLIKDMDFHVMNKDLFLGIMNG